MTTAIRVLLIEDSDTLSGRLFEFLEPRGVVLDRAQDGLAGLQIAGSNSYDVIVIDLMQPGLSGNEVCRRLRAGRTSPAPVLMLTSRETVADRLTSFAAGADDCLVKPFDFLELEARLWALTQRRQRPDCVLKVGTLSFDTGTLCLHRSTRRLHLSRAGERLLQPLMRSYPNVVYRRDLEHALWGDDPPDSDTLRTHIHAVRHAIDHEFDHKMLLTLHRVGYRLVADGDAI